jgi:hypothetical protein
MSPRGAGRRFREEHQRRSISSSPGQSKTIDSISRFRYAACYTCHLKKRAISSEVAASWLFLLFNLPAKHASERVKVWRRLKKFGAVQLKTSNYVLPDEPAHYERFQWLAKEIDDSGGEALGNADAFYAL